MTPSKNILIPQNLQILRLNNSTLDFRGPFHINQFWSVSRFFSLAAIRELWLASPMPRGQPASGEFSCFIRAMSSLTTLMTHTSNVTKMLPILDTTTSDTFEDGRFHTPCHNLDTLYVYGSSMLLNLPRFAERRAALGHPLRCLRLGVIGLNLEESTKLCRHISDVKIVDTQHFIKEMLHPIWPVPSGGYNWRGGTT
jgi:hypothetical protein